METTIIQPSKESLFQIGEHFYALENLIIEAEGEITEEIDQWLSEYQGKEEDKIDAYCYLIQRYEEIAYEAKRLAERSAQYRGKISSLKDRLKLYLEMRDKSKVETSRFTITVCKNGGLRPITLSSELDADKLPDQFVRLRKEPDLHRIREALQYGDEAAMQFARLEERGTHLRIK